jgi:hypothetical protein
MSAEAAGLESTNEPHGRPSAKGPVPKGGAPSVLLCSEAGVLY